MNWNWEVKIWNSEFPFTIRNSTFEIRHALRALRRAPGFAAAAILTLALGIGANTAIFSLVYGVLLRPLPYRDASRLVLLDARREFAGQREAANFSAPALDDWRGRTRSFASVAGYAAAELELDTDRGVEPLEAMCVSTRLLRDDWRADGRRARDRRRRRRRPRSPSSAAASGGGTSAAIRISSVARSALSGGSYTIVGVARPDFLISGDSTDIWIPLDLAKTNGVAPWLASPRGGGMNVLARLKPGVTVAQAQADVSAVAREIAQASPAADKNVSLAVTPVIDHVAGSVRPALLLLLAAVGLVLLVACANVANLLLARQSGRARDIAVRLALGAPRGRLVAQAMIESAILALLGGAGGVLLATASVRLLVWLQPAQLPRLDAIRVDGPVLLFAATVAAAAALVAGGWPALRASREDAAEALRTSGSGSAPRGRRLGKTLAVAEMAVSIVLLVGASLLARSLVDLLRTDVGARTDHTLAVLLDFSLGRRLPASEEIARGNAIVARVRALPGVQYAALGAAVPPSRERVRFTLKDQPTARGVAKELEMAAVPVTADFFRALGVPLVGGRLFDAGDTADRPPVMIMSADTARLFFGDQPLGHTLSLPTTTRGNATTTLVGVVGNVRYRGLAQSGAERRLPAVRPAAVEYGVPRGADERRSARRRAGRPARHRAGRSADRRAERELARCRSCRIKSRSRDSARRCWRRSPASRFCWPPSASTA